MFISAKTLSRILIPYIKDRGDSFGLDATDGLRDPASPDAGRKKVVVEFSSPNLGTEFHGAHLRSTIIGASVASMYKARGWDVIKLNYLGDWGKSIGLLAVGWDKFGSEEHFQADPLRHLLEIYNQVSELFKPEQDEYRRLRDANLDVSIVESSGIWAARDAFCKRMEDGETEALDLWKKFREVSIEHYTKLYSSLNITFDEYSGESEVKPETVAEVEAILKEKGLYEEIDGGSWQINFENLGAKKLGTVVTRFKTGTTAYLLRDLAAVLERDRKYAFDKMVYVVTGDQHTHFQQIFKVLEAMGFDSVRSRIEHLEFGKVQGLTSETPHSLLLSDIIQRCQTAAATSIEAVPDDFSVFELEDPETPARLGISALLVQDLSTKRGNILHFDLAKMASPGLNNGIKLQYWHANLTRKLKDTPPPPEGEEEADYYASIEEEAFADVLRLLAQFPDIVKRAAKDDEPSAVLGYVFRVLEQLGGVMEDDDEGGGWPEDTPARLALYECVLRVLGNAMAILGIVPVFG